MRARLAAVLVVALVALPLFAQDRIVITPPDVIWIPGGLFTMGADQYDLLFAVELCNQDLEMSVPDTDAGHCRIERFVEELGVRRLYVPTFGLDRTEVTNAAYRRCVRAGRCAPSSLSDATDVLTGDDHPVVGVRFSEASDYCAFVGGRLPDEPEWEKAARGDDPERRFPWGRLYQSRLSNHGRSPLRTDPIDGFLLSAPVGSFPGGASPYGVLDLAGNVWEWTREIPIQPETGTLSGFRVIRGGSYAHPITTLRVTMRTWVPLDTDRGDLGFRCAYDAPPPATSTRR